MWTRWDDSEAELPVAAGGWFAGENCRRTDGWRWLNTRRRILPLLHRAEAERRRMGERAGVRAGVATN